MVISWKINRIRRRLLDVLKIVNVFEKNNITYKFYSEPFDITTPVGKIRYNVRQNWSEKRRRDINQIQYWLKESMRQS